MALSLLIIAVILLVIELIYFRIADHFNIIDKPNLRSSHKHITLRGGGIIFLAATWIYCLFFGLNYPWFMVGLTAICAVSFIDDIHSIPNRIRLLVHFAAMLLMFQQLGILTTENWWQIIPALILCTGIINAYNFMDGINGITGGYSLIVLLPLILLNFDLHFVDSSFLIVAALGVLVFCVFNFRPKGKAKCFAGDVGSISIAFIMLFAIGRLVVLTQDVTYLIFLLVYGVDGCLTIFHRILLHENLGEAHRKHTYQLMANELKIGHVKVSLVYMFMQLAVSFGFIYLCPNTVAGHWGYLVGALAVLSVAYVLFKKKYYHLHEEYLASLKK